MDDDEKRTIKSFWWLPASPEVRWFGTLVLEKGESPNLELIIERSQTPDEFLRNTSSVIHGKDEHGKPVTLLFASLGGDSASGAVVKRHIDAGFALIGIKADNAEEVSLNSLRFSLQHLCGWLGRTGFQRAEAEGRGKFTVNFQQREDQWYEITSDLELCLHNTYETRSSFYEEGIREGAAMTFRSKNGFSLAKGQELINYIRSLLHFAIFKQIYPVWMTGYKNGYGRQIGDRWLEHDIEIESALLRKSADELPIADLWLFRFEDFQSNFAEFFHEWMDYAEQFDEAMDCYFSTVYHSLTGELAHLSLTQALEAYHGIKFSSHQAREFRQKIEDLCNTHTNSLKGLVDNIPDFADRVLHTRNYYTHHNPRWLTGGKVAKKRDLVLLNEKLKLLFQICVLSDIKVPSNRFPRLRRQLATQIIDYP